MNGSKMRKHKSLLVLLCILAVPMLACSTVSTQGDGANTTSQQVKQYMAMARQDAINAGIPPDLFVRQINQESGFDPQALSPSGAEGIAQFMPETAANLGIDPWNPVEALKGAAQLMAHYTKMFAGAYAKALATYNAGLGAVQHALKVCGKVRWMNCLPVETQQYIAAILG
jgi:soluble lytic murein transglycosylase-like protein